MYQKSPEHLLSTPMHTTNCSMAANSTPPKDSRAADPARVASNIDLRHETGDLGSNSIVELCVGLILQSIESYCEGKSSVN